MARKGPKGTLLCFLEETDKRYLVNEHRTVRQSNEFSKVI